MAGIFRLLASVAAHAAWQRAGRGGPLPPIRIPGKRTTHLPVPAPWQMMAATWAAERLWSAYGPQVKRKLADNPSPLAHKIVDFLPGPTDTTGTLTAPAPVPAPAPISTPTAAPMPTPATAPVTGNTAPAQSAPPARPQAPSGAATQRLPQSPDDTLPPGSVLNSLRSSG